jgi:hypothetical protein
VRIYGHRGPARPIPKAQRAAPQGCLKRHSCDRPKPEIKGAEGKGESSAV